MPVVSSRRYPTTTGSTLPPSGSYRTSLDRPYYSTSTGSYITSRVSSYARSSALDAYRGDVERKMASTYISNTGYHKSPESRFLRTDSRTREYSLDSGITSKSDPLPRTEASLNKTLATSAADIINKYSPANYIPKCELVRSRSLSDSRQLKEKSQGSKAQPRSKVKGGPTRDRTKTDVDSFKTRITNKPSASKGSLDQIYMKSQSFVQINNNTKATPSNQTINRSHLNKVNIKLDNSINNTRPSQHSDSNGNSKQSISQLSVAEIRKKFDSQNRNSSIAIQNINKLKGNCVLNKNTKLVKSGLTVKSDSISDVSKIMKNNDKSCKTVIEVIHSVRQSEKLNKNVQNSMLVNGYEFAENASHKCEASENKRSSVSNLADRVHDKQNTKNLTKNAVIQIKKEDKSDAELCNLQKKGSFLNLSELTVNTDNEITPNVKVFSKHHKTESTPIVTDGQEILNHESVSTFGSKSTEDKLNVSLTHKAVPYVSYFIDINDSIPDNACNKSTPVVMQVENPIEPDYANITNIEVTPDLEQDRFIRINTIQDTYADKHYNSNHTSDLPSYIQFNQPINGCSFTESKVQDLKFIDSEIGIDETDIKCEPLELDITGENITQGNELQLKSANDAHSDLNDRESMSNWQRDTSYRRFDNGTSPSTSSSRRTTTFQSTIEPPTSRDRINSLRATNNASLLRAKSSERDDDTAAGLNGLRNIGNTCFMNSVLQCLSNTRLLLEFIRKDSFIADLGSGGALIKAFSSVIGELWGPGNSRVVNTSQLKGQIQRFAPRFMGYAQQDAQEFLRYLLEGLHEDVNRVKGKPSPILTDIDDHLTDAQKAAESWSRYVRSEDSRIVELFVGQLKSTLRCTVCGHSSVTFDPFWDLSLPIPSRVGQLRLSQCLDLFTKEEVLDGDEKPTCAKCNVRRKCTKSFSIQKFPKILVIHLKRFSPTERFRGKLSNTIECPLTGLDLSSYAANKGATSNYSLYAVSNHSGTTYSGHYTAYCKHPYNHEWHEYNDSRVSSIAARNVVSSEAYVLFYELI